MDARALLTSQGWRGTGHSLHASSDAIGLSRPLLVSQKQNTLGIGKKQHGTSDQWWMSAFDSTLKGLETGEGKGGEVTVVQTVRNGGLDMVVKGRSSFVGGVGGLYACFVRGEGLRGTMGVVGEDEGEKEEVVKVKEVRKATKSISKSKSTKKRKRETETETKYERRARKAAKRAAKASPAPAETGAEIAENTPVVQISELTSDAAEDKKITLAAGGLGTERETKEQRRERRRLKKLQKLADEEPKTRQVVSSKNDADSEDSGEKKKKRRKEKKV